MMRSMCQDVAYQLMQQATQAEAVSCISGSILMLLVSWFLYTLQISNRGGGCEHQVGLRHVGRELEAIRH